MARQRNPKARGLGELRRKRWTRPQYDRVLIVCEGRKTEPNYFEEIRQEARIPSAHVSVLHSEFGTEPLQIVEFAEAEFLRGRAYDRIYAVFDRDDHQTYANAIAKAGAQNGRLRNDESRAIVFDAVVSVPCFELWLLLHFADIQAWLHRTDAVNRLRGHIPAYAKGKEGIYFLTRDLLATATDRAERLKARFSRLPGDEAYTDVHELVALLRALRTPRA